MVQIFVDGLCAVDADHGQVKAFEPCGHGVLGPGVHGSDGTIEFHNTYLEILACSGAIGGVFFVLYTIRCIRKLWNADWTLIPIIVSIYAYGIAGFAMRRLAYWCVMVFVTVIAKQLLEQTAAENGFGYRERERMRLLPNGSYEY